MFVNSFPQRAKAKPGRPSGGAKKEELLQLARHGASITHQRGKCNWSMSRQKPAPDPIRGVKWFGGKDMLQNIESPRVLFDGMVSSRRDARCGIYAALMMFFRHRGIRLSSVMIRCKKRHINLGP